MERTHNMICYRLRILIQEPIRICINAFFLYFAMQQHPLLPFEIIHLAPVTFKVPTTKRRFVDTDHTNVLCGDVII